MHELRRAPRGHGWQGHGHRGTARTMGCSVQVSQGVPTLAQDVVEDGRLAGAARQCVALRRRFAALLTPPDFASPRDLRWHGASPGVPSLYSSHVIVSELGANLFGTLPVTGNWVSPMRHNPSRSPATGCRKGA